MNSNGSAEPSAETPRERGWLWDYEDCPVNGCAGELQQQDKFNVMCLSCEGIFTHWKDGDTHRLLNKDDDTVAKKARIVPDGGTESEPSKTVPVDEELEEAVSWVERELREARRALWDGKSGKAFASIEAAQEEFETVEEAILDE